MSNLLGGLHTLDLGEYSSGSVEYDMTLYYGEYKHNKILIKFFLGKKINSFYLDTLCFFGFQILFIQNFVSILVMELKYFFK